VKFLCQGRRDGGGTGAMVAGGCSRAGGFA
jgi:hypothetical protein